MAILNKILEPITNKIMTPILSDDDSISDPGAWENQDTLNWENLTVDNWEVWGD
jgi:hypothetical protein